MILIVIKLSSVHIQCQCYFVNSLPLVAPLLLSPGYKAACVSFTHCTARCFDMHSFANQNKASQTLCFVQTIDTVQFPLLAVASSEHPFCSATYLTEHQALPCEVMYHVVQCVLCIYCSVENKAQPSQWDRAPLCKQLPFTRNTRFSNPMTFIAGKPICSNVLLKITDGTFPLLILK